MGKLHFDIQKLALLAVGVMVTHLTLIKYEEYVHNLEEAFKEFEEYRVYTLYKLIYATK